MVFIIFLHKLSNYFYVFFNKYDFSCKSDIYRVTFYEGNTTVITIIIKKSKQTIYFALLRNVYELKTARLILTVLA